MTLKCHEAYPHFELITFFDVFPFLWVTGSILLVALIGLLVFFILRNRRKAKPNPVQEGKPNEMKEKGAPDVCPIENVAPIPKIVEKTPEDTASGTDTEEDFYATLGNRRKRIPFESRIKRLDHDTYRRYKGITSALRKYDFTDRMSVPGETFSYKWKKLVFITIIGSTLKIHFAIDPHEFENDPIPVKDASHIVKFAEYPSYLVIRSDLAMRRAIQLGERVAQENKIPLA